MRVPKLNRLEPLGSEGIAEVEATICRVGISCSLVGKHREGKTINVEPQQPRGFAEKISDRFHSKFPKKVV